MTAIKLHSRYVEKIWGRRDVPGAPQSDEPIGELWFEAPEGAPDPLLVKHIFTSEKLSIQVHPNDAQGQARGIAGGKEECWYILDADPEATIGVGTLRPLSGEELRAAALDGSIEQLMDWRSVKPGDFFFLKAGTVHAIGAGISLVEVQQNVDITYRLYDYGRPRELHLDDGVAVSHAEPYVRPVPNEGLGSEATLLDEPGAPFAVALHHLDADGERSVSGDGLAWFVPLRGQGMIAGQAWQTGECWLVQGNATIVAQDAADFLIATQ